MTEPSVEPAAFARLAASFESHVLQCIERQQHTGDGIRDLKRALEGIAHRMESVSIEGQRRGEELQKELAASISHIYERIDAKIMQAEDKARRSGDAASETSTRRWEKLIGFALHGLIAGLTAAIAVIGTKSVGL